MVKGETYSKQLFESEAFRHFINIFLNKESGVTKGCELSIDSQNITVGEGMFCILGGFLRETTGTANQIPNEAGYYKLVYEIDLSKTNTKDQFNQGDYKFVKSLGNYPNLIQEDLDNKGNVYQFEFCQFRITDEGIQDFKDTRTFINYGIYVRKAEKSSITVWNSSNQAISKGNNFKFKFSKFNLNGDYFQMTSDNKIKVLKDCRACISSRIFVEDSSGKGYVQTITRVNNSETISVSLQEILDEYYTNCISSNIIYDFKENDIVELFIDYTSDSGNPKIRSEMQNSSITIFTV